MSSFHRPNAHTLELWFPCPRLPSQESFLCRGTSNRSPWQNSSGAPFVQAGTPDPSLALITADQFDNLIDCEKDFFILSPRSSLCSIEIFSHLVSAVWKRSSKQNKEEKKKKSHRPHLFPFTCFLCPPPQKLQIWLQRCSNWKAFVCFRSYCSLINCKLDGTRCLARQLAKLSLLWSLCFSPI